MSVDVLVTQMRHLYTIVGPQDLSRKLNWVGNMNFGNGNAQKVMQMLRHIHGCFEGAFSKDPWIFFGCLHDCFEHAPLPKFMLPPQFSFLDRS